MVIKNACVASCTVCLFSLLLIFVFFHFLPVNLQNYDYDIFLYCTICPFYMQRLGIFTTDTFEEISCDFHGPRYVNQDFYGIILLIEEFMLLGDFLKNALANEPNLPPVQNPGLSSAKETVDVEFLPSKTIVKAYLGQNLGLIAKAAKIDIKYKCKKGECGTCTVNFNGKLVKACQGSLPSISKEKKFQIGIISK